MQNNTEIVGIDVGNGYTKTVHSEFVSAVKDFGTAKPSIIDKTVMYNGRYYTVGGKRSKTKTDQKDDDTAFILALAALGEEFKFRNVTPGHVIISEGLPIERCIETNKEIDKHYYKKGESISFCYEDNPYNVFIDEVYVNPQGVSGILNKSKQLPDICLVADVGSWTVDLIPIINGKPESSETKSLNAGVISCMLSCNEEIRRVTGREVLEEQIQKIMRGNRNVLPPKYEDIVISGIENYVKSLFDTFIENGYNVDTMPTVFIGGGATVVKNFGAKYFPLSQYYTDIHCNAEGYEWIANMFSKKQN